ncbi:hypothetical protein BC835DRAFT_1303886 [Cytidiella melzeri]|nr:hypothetical protein BC835DRAFT_1303886 [Cytidiella melzeri]
MLSTAPSTSKTWNKTPPLSPSLLCAKTFPTPSDAARIASEEKARRLEALKAKRTTNLTEEEVPSGRSRGEEEVAPPTPISIGQTGEHVEQQQVTQREAVTEPPTEKVVNKQAKTKKTRTASTPKRKSAKTKAGLETENRFDVLGDRNGDGGREEHHTDHEDAREQPNTDLSASQARHTKEKRRGRNAGMQEGLVRGSPAIEQAALTPKLKPANTPYDSNKSHHATLREMSRSERRASLLEVDHDEDMEDLERWLQSGGIEALEQMSRQEEEGLGLRTEMEGLNTKLLEAYQQSSPLPSQIANEGNHQMFLGTAGEQSITHTYVFEPPSNLSTPITPQPPNAQAQHAHQPTTHIPPTWTSTEMEERSVRPGENVAPDPHPYVSTPHAQPPACSPNPSQHPPPQALPQAALTREETANSDFRRTETTARPEPADMTLDELSLSPNLLPQQPAHFVTGPHEPRVLTLKELKFSTLAENYSMPRGNDPFYPFDNLAREQMREWPNSPGRSVLVRLAGKGYPAAAKEQARKEEIILLLRRTVGIPNRLRITAPSAANPESGNNKPPFNFLLYNFDDEYLNYLRNFGGCISTTEGTLFFSTNGPVIDSLIGTIEGFDDNADEHQLRVVINRAFDECDLNGTIISLAKGHEQLAQLAPEMVVTRIRELLAIKIVETNRQDDSSFRVAHLFLDSPTSNPIEWRSFRDKALKASFKDPFLGMNIRAIKCWICGICTSALHLKSKCPILTEPGWLFDPSLNSTTSATTNANRDPPTTFTTVQTANRSGNGRDSSNGRGRGNKGRSNRGRGRGCGN